MASDVEVEIEPKEPVLNESFFVTFKVKTTDSEEPYISFTPQGASVLGKRSQGLSISTVVINGKFTTTKEQAIVYELAAEREGQVYLKNVSVEINDRKMAVKDIRINVLKEPARLDDAFIEAEASKTKLFLGEGMNVHYYLYFKNQISANDVKEFPKLNKFIKRFQHINSPVETVQYKGQVFRRILAYSARLYAEKVGNAVLDPMVISAQVLEVKNNGFGYGSQRFKNIDLASQRIDVEILALPSDGVPPSFTGLVGQHDFKVTLSKNKFLINEPIEIRLEVTGKGALENYDAPVLYQDNNLEQFDTNSEIKEIGIDAAKKTFDYTYLARGPLKIAERQMSFGYFNPDTKQYEQKIVIIPGIEVGGVAATTSTSPKQDNNSSNKKEESSLNNLFSAFKPSVQNELGIVGPVLKDNNSWNMNIYNIINIVFIIIILILGYFNYKKLYQAGAFAASKVLLKRDIKNLKKNGMNYSILYKALTILDTKNLMALGGVSLKDVVNQSTLSGEAKSYFIDALDSLESRSFNSNYNGVNKANFVEKHFKELMRKI